MSIDREILSNNISKLVGDNRNCFYLISINFKFRLVLFLLILSLFFFFVIWLFFSFFFIFFTFLSSCSFCSFFISLSFSLGLLNFLLSFNQNLSILIVSIKCHFKLRRQTFPTSFEFLKWFFFELNSIIVLL